MRLPRDISGDDLVKALHRYGYRTTRQTGSHIRLTLSAENKEFHITIPKHDPLRIGTLNNILKDLSIQHEIEKDDLIRQLFAK